MIFGFFTWVLSLFSGGIVDKILDAITKTEDARIEAKKIDASTVKEAIKAYVEIQKAETVRYQFPWFWLMAAPFILSIGVFFILLTIYNVAWHPNGIWPQDWEIAAYPGVYQEWATTAFNWIFAPAMGVLAVKKLIK